MGSNFFLNMGLVKREKNVQNRELFPKTPYFGQNVRLWGGGGGGEAPLSGVNQTCPPLVISHFNHTSFRSIIKLNSLFK